MPMTASEHDEWLRVVRPLLGSIRSHSSWVKYHSRSIGEKVRMLPYAPNFETEAVADMDAAIGELTDAIELLKEAREQYSRKKVKK